MKTRYHAPSPEDPAGARLWRTLTRRRVPDFPRTVQIQTMTGCNGACVFCPYPLTVDSQPKGFMKASLFEAIIGEIADRGVRRISPYLMNEPFLDPEMVDRLVVIKRRIPSAKIVVTSNGSLLTPELSGRLIEAGALHALYVSLQGMDKASYEGTMKGSLAFEETLGNVLGLVERWKAAGGRRRFKLVITMVKTNRFDAERAVAFWRERGVESQWTPLENRGGNVSLAQDLAPRGHTMRRFANCTRLFKQAYIMFDGDMVLCCTDYRREVVLGNVEGSSIAGVWNSPRARALRRLYAEGQMDEIALCRNCQISDTTGEEVFE